MASGIGGGFCPIVPRQITPAANATATAANSAACQTFKRFISGVCLHQWVSGVPTHGLTQAGGQW
jgi:hypothetical protein